MGGIILDGNGDGGGHTQNVKYVREKEEKSCKLKITGENLSIKSTRQMRTQEDTTQRKNKSKQSTKIT